MWNMLLLNYCSRALRPSQKRFCTTNLLDDDLSQPATNSSDAFRITALQKKTLPASRSSRGSNLLIVVKGLCSELRGAKSFTRSQGGGGGGGS